MAFIVNEPVEEYAAEHTTELRRALRAAGRGDTGEDDRAADDGRPDRGRLPRRRSSGSPARSASSSSARSPATRRSRWRPRCPTDGRIITCDVDPDATSIARRYMDESGHGDKIEIRLGPGARDDRDAWTARSTSSSSTRTSRTTRATTRRCCRCWPRTACSSPTTCSGRVGSSSPTATSRRRRSRHSTSTSGTTTASISVMLTVRDGMTLVQLRSGALLK